ncbi:TPA: N-acetyltransferase family protein [Serratia fonticola]|nr:Protease synthase and sporulation negative regulatory protein PAI 1 [Serratia fonticola]
MSQLTTNKEAIVFTIRQALPADLATVREIGIASYLAHFAELWQNQQALQAFLSKDFAEQALEPSLQDRDTCWLLAYEGETPVGFAKLNFDSLQAATATLGAELQKIYFLPQFAGRGYGERLYAEIQRRAIERGQPILWLDVLKSNVAGQRFYQRQGMAIVGEESYTSVSQSVAMWVMAKDL